MEPILGSTAWQIWPGYCGWLCRCCLQPWQGISHQHRVHPPQFSLFHLLVGPVFKSCRNSLNPITRSSCHQRQSHVRSSNCPARSEIRFSERFYSPVTRSLDASTKIISASQSQMFVKYFHIKYLGLGYPHSTWLSFGLVANYSMRVRLSYMALHLGT